VSVNRSQDYEDLLPGLDISDAMRQRPLGLGSWKHLLRVALAVTVSYLVAEWVSRSTLGIFAPITTLLVVQSSPWSTLGVSIQRILGTGLGVLAASLWVNVVGLSWWSFLVGVLAALLVARALPWSLGGQMQIPVAVIFVLALGPGTLSADLWRVVDVVIGGVVGLLAVFIFPPQPRPRAFEHALSAYRDGIVEILESIGRESGSLTVPLSDEELHEYVTRSRALRDLADKARQELVHLVEASHWNLRAAGVRPQLDDKAMRLRRLTGIGIQVRGLVGAANRVFDRDGTAPLLDAEAFEALVDREVALMHVVLGPVGAPVAGVDRAQAGQQDHELGEQLRLAADAAFAAPDHADLLLASISIIGRLDHIRAQLADFPSWPDDQEEA